MAREQFAAEINSEILAGIRDLAQKEGRPVDALVEEALADVIEKHRMVAPRPGVMAAYLTSHERFATLYKKLAE
jgi:hypothetical protein